jgi:hypothetical protein
MDISQYTRYLYSGYKRDDMRKIAHYDLQYVIGSKAISKINFNTTHASRQRRLGPSGRVYRTVPTGN